MKQLQGFDPLLFLNIQANTRNKDVLSFKLLDQISQYITIRITQMLPDEVLNNIKTPQQLFTVAEQSIPDLDKKVKEYLDDFKKEFLLKTR